MSNDPRDILTENIGSENSIAQLPEGAVTSDDDDIEALFERAFDKFPESDFLSNVYDWWEAKQFLTEAQYNAVKRIAKED